jgi:hypothetical protein
MNTYIVISYNRIIICWFKLSNNNSFLSIYFYIFIQIFYLLLIIFKTTGFYLIKIFKKYKIIFENQINFKF